MKNALFLIMTASAPCLSSVNDPGCCNTTSLTEATAPSTEENFTEKLSQPKYPKEMLRLKPYEPSYLVLKSHSSGSNKYKKEYTGLNAHFSFSYDFFAADNYRWKVFGSYTGEFDFYLLARDSDPVINRLNNPAVHLRLLDRASWPNRVGADFIDFALEHKSDGQTQLIQEENLTSMNEAYYKGNERYFDDIDMGDNYFSAEAKFSKTRHNLYIKFKLYPEGKEEEIIWGNLAGKNVTIEDFDRWRILYTAKQKNGNEFSAAWTIGDRWFKADSFNVDYMINICNTFPLYFRFHSGPLETQSNYSFPVNSFAVGIKFAPYL